MPGEKELNVNLLERLDLVERIEMVAESGDIEAIRKQLAIEKKFIERKLYQNPPLTSDRQ